MLAAHFLATAYAVISMGSRSRVFGCNAQYGQTNDHYQSKQHRN